MRSPRSLLTVLALAASLTTSACKDDAPSGSTEASAGEADAGEADAGEADADAGEAGPRASKPGARPDEGPLPSLRTGVDQPEELAAVSVDLLTGADGKPGDGGHYYAFSLPTAGSEGLLRVHIAGSVHGVPTIDRGQSTVLVRLPSDVEAPTQLQGTAYLQSVGSDGPAVQALPFTASGAGKATDAAELPSRWAAAFAAELRNENTPWWMRSSSHPWREFAAGRVQALVAGRGAGTDVNLGPDMQPRRTDLAELMHTTTAATSMQEALQHDRGLRLPFDSGPASVPISELSGPALVAHPFEQMLAALPDANAGTPEPLAKATPSEFWYVRFDDIRVMLRTLDEADAWLTPLAHMMEERAEVHDLSKRYQRQLGLRRTGLAKTLGNAVVERVAVMGSDPYLREGSDVTFVFALRNQGVFESELARHMDEYRAELPGIEVSTITHAGHSITVSGDPSGAVRQHRCLVPAAAGEPPLAIVSNSAAAIAAVLDTIDGKRRALAEDKDLVYMLARDPGAHDGFAFLGDHFIAEVVGPRQKLLAARRQQALAELLTPGFGALLYGWLEGHAPADSETLIDAGLLDRSELQHGDGAPISFAPGGPARSSWGSPSSLVPLIELPAPTLVSEAERDAYNTFARGYQDYWRQFMDPIAIRFDLEDGAGDSATATVDVRVLPLIEGTDYGQVEDIVGTERIEVPAIDDGLQMVWAVGGDSELRRELDRSASALTGKADIGIGWLGAWVMVGTLDRRPLLDMILELDEFDVQLPKTEAKPEAFDDDLRLAQLAGKLPVYAAAQIRNPVALVATLTAIKAAANEVAPGVLLWGEYARYRDYPIVRVGVSPTKVGDMGGYALALALYYVQVDDVLVIALRPKVVEALIDRVVDGGGPKRGAKDGPQFVMEARVAKDQSGWMAIALALQDQANRSQSAARSTAEILLRGDPSLRSPAELIALGKAYLGAYPVSASGHADFTLRPEGVGDPVHGSALAPAFPPLPVEGSPIAALMDRLTSMRASVAFDREAANMTPPARSLHTQVQLQLGASQD